MLKSQDEEVLTLWIQHHLVRSPRKTMRAIKFKKESSSKKGIVHSIKLGRKEIHQGKIRFWENIKLWAKREGHQDRKDSNMKKMREKWMQKFSTCCERIINSSKDTRDMRLHERSFKLRGMSKNEDSSRVKSNQIEEDEEKKK